MDAKEPEKSHAKGDGPLLLVWFVVAVAFSAWLSTIPEVMWIFR